MGYVVFLICFPQILLHRLHVHCLRKNRRNTINSTNTKLREQVIISCVCLSAVLTLWHVRWSFSLDGFNNFQLAAKPEFFLFLKCIHSCFSGAVSVPPSSPAVQPVYSPVAGPPPRFDSTGTSSFSAATGPVQGAQPAPAQPAAVVTKPSAQSFAQATAPPPATAATTAAATGSALNALPPPAPVAPVAPVQTAQASAQKKDNDDSSDHEGEYSPPPFAPGHTPPPTPPPAVVAPTAPVDPMEAMLARLAALK